MNNNSPHRRRGTRAQAARAALLPLVMSGAATCPRCQQPITPDQSWDAGHVDDLGLGGSPSGRVVPEHSDCNRSAGGRLGQLLRRPARRRPAAWLSSARFFSGPTPKDTWDPLESTCRHASLSIL